MMSPEDRLESILAKLAARPVDAHKGTFGTALLVGGSLGMTGAIALSGMAALRGGAGLVRLAVPETCLAMVASHEPAYTTVPLPSDRHGRIHLDARELIAREASRATTIALGPGLGRSAGLDALVDWLDARLPQAMVIDADALNALAQRRRSPVTSSPWSQSLASRGGTRILTPHPGEFARLVGASVGRSRQEQCEQAVGLADAHDAVVVLKGYRTLVTDGLRRWFNPTGNPGMATGGTGDVLTGLITAFSCQGLNAFDAACLGVFVHGRAGDLAAARLGQVALTASDLIAELSNALLAQS